MQLALWLAVVAEGLGTSLQHREALIENRVPTSWHCRPIASALPRQCRLVIPPRSRARPNRLPLTRSSRWMAMREEGRAWPIPINYPARPDRLRLRSPMQIVNAIPELPATPAVYAMHGGADRYRYVAYVGVADDLRRRINQHLVRRDSGITTGIAAVSLIPDLVTEVDWWQHGSFGQDVVLEAAELVAFEVLNPALRSRGAVQKLAVQYLDAQPGFVTDMRSLFSNPPTGRLVRPSLQVALERIAVLERRVAELEQRVGTSHETSQ